MCHSILDGVVVKQRAGLTPASITASPSSVVLTFDDGSEIDLTGEVEWGEDADPAKRAFLAKIAVQCGWAKSVLRAHRAMKLFPSDFVGELWPPPPPEWRG